MSTLETVPGKYTQAERDRLVSLVFAVVDNRFDKNMVRIPATGYTFIPEHVGFQMLPVHEKQQSMTGTQHYVIKGLYRPPLIHDLVENVYIKHGSTKKYGVFCDRRPRQEDWIIDYEFFIWHLPTLESTFLGEPITQSLKAAKLCREKYATEMQRKELKPYMIIVVQEKCPNHTLLRRQIQQTFTDIPIVILMEENIKKD